MDKQNNSNLDALLNNLIENFGEDDPVTQKVESLMEENVNLLLVGATGSGKSSTINAMFNMQVANVGVGVDPETACIEKYELGGLTIWDTPGLGDGVERDIEIATAIKAKLAETDEDNRQVIDMVLIVLDASTKDLAAIYTLANEVLLPGLGDEAEQRILIGLNQSDMAMKGRHWNDASNEPDEVLKDFLNRKAESVRQRIQENTGLDLKVVCYCAGYTEEDDQRSPYNLMKLLHFILRHTPTEKRLVLVENLNEDSENWAHNDDDDDHRTTVLDDILFSIGVGLDAGIETGGEIGDFLLGLPGKVVGGAVGSVVGAVGGAVSQILFNIFG